VFVPASRSEALNPKVAAAAVNPLTPLFIML